MEQGTNGYVRWRDLDERDQRLRHEAETKADKVALDAAQQREKALAELNTRFERGHEFWTASHQGLADRVDRVESVLDQQRGARNLVYALIGSNLLLVVVSVVSVAHLLGLIG